jgi:aldose 1-epimerase
VRTAAAALALLAGAPASAASVTQAPYGTTKAGEKVTQVTLRNDRGMEVKLIGLGAILTDIIVPDAAGRRENVALGFGSLAEYEARNGDYFFGGAVGRYAGRIAGAGFTLEGKRIALAANDGQNTLHGGPGGFINKVWKVEPFQRGANVGAVLSYLSPAGEQGFPGNLSVRITYTLQSDNALRIDYQATTDAPTAVNFTNHSYFNLAGAGSGTALDHQLRIHSTAILQTAAGGIPTGAMLPVSGTPFDFRRLSPIRAKMAMRHEQLGDRGLNHSWVLGNRGRLRSAALLRDPASGREMEVLTTEPSLHAYTAGYFPGTDTGPRGTVYRPFDAIALETQHFPDAPNRRAFPSTILRPGETWRSTTLYRFHAGKPELK